MKRYVMGIITAAVMAVTLGCGGGSSPAPPAPAPAPAPVPGPPAPVIDPMAVSTEIVMSKNFLVGDSTVNASCIGTATSPFLPAKRGQKVHWYLVNDRINPCNQLSAADVELRFDLDFGEDDMNPATAVKIIKWNMGQGRLQTKVHSGTMNGRRKYYVYYKNMKASPDPEVDIDGDCGASCGPGGP